MYCIQNADQSYRTARYVIEDVALRALRKLKAVDSAVVWFNDGGVPKVWVAYWRASGVEMAAVVPVAPVIEAPNVETGVGTLAYEFPDFAAADVPADIPAWMATSHWHNDSCPSWFYQGPEGVVSLYVDYVDATRREMNDGPRFTLIAHDAEWGHIGAYQTESWPEALASLLMLRWVCGHGLSIHPDTRGVDYVIDKTGERALTDEQAAAYEADLDAITALGEDIYQAAYNAFYAMGVITAGERASC